MMKKRSEGCGRGDEATRRGRLRRVVDWAQALMELLAKLLVELGGSLSWWARVGMEAAGRRWADEDEADAGDSRG